MAETQDPVAPAKSKDELLLVYNWRLEQALDLGVSINAAHDFAGDSTRDLHRLRELIKEGCRPDTAAKIA